ncbi:hypothetical protein [Mariniphaga sediminis]|uniref:hypothetical protein n=1 Tax=Mariniphaga sediminis TaxID=1628158 RepID=UPI003568DC65
MKTTDFAIQRVYSILNESVDVWLLDLPIYKLTKPSKKKDTEYIVLNSLPIGPGVLQKCRVNVNYHVKDLSPGIPDLEKLEANTASLMALLEDVPAKGIIINFESQEYFREDGLGEHYSNIRLSVKIVND